MWKVSSNYRKKPSLIFNFRVSFTRWLFPEWGWEVGERKDFQDNLFWEQGSELSSQFSREPAVRRWVGVPPSLSSVYLCKRTELTRCLLRLLSALRFHGLMLLAVSVRTLLPTENDWRWAWTMQPGDCSDHYAFNLLTPCSWHRRSHLGGHMWVAIH